MDSRSPRALIDTPPVWLAGFLALAWAQAALVPILPAPGWLRPAGAVLAGAGLLVLLWALAAFRAQRTSVVPRERPSAVLTGGPFAFSRNPIYLADAMILGGLVLRWDLASLPLVPAFAALIARRFIAAEEAVCAAAFGTAWAGYAARVRRRL